MNPGTHTLKTIEHDPRYVREGAHSIDIYPGWGTITVYRHSATDTLWGRYTYHSDDTSEEGREWFEVEATTTVRYSEKRKP